MRDRRPRAVRVTLGGNSFCKRGPMTWGRTERNARSSLALVLATRYDCGTPAGKKASWNATNSPSSSTPGNMASRYFARRATSCDLRPRRELPGLASVSSTLLTKSTNRFLRSPRGGELSRMSSRWNCTSGSRSKSGSTFCLAGELLAGRVSRGAIVGSTRAAGDFVRDSVLEPVGRGRDGCFAVCAPKSFRRTSNRPNCPPLASNPTVSVLRSKLTTRP